MRIARKFPAPAALMCVVALASALLLSCTQSMKTHMRPPEQGIYGTFTTYGPLPDDQKRNCEPLKTQAEKDECRKFNERTIEEPLVATIRIHNLTTDSSMLVALDAAGSYKVKLMKGSYEVCLGEDCSDPLDVTMNTFVPYGGRRPKK
jgi:hypothetical protein